eukprot:scaffold62656_cov57-Phaeocystis_antarctica.AAC.2
MEVTKEVTKEVTRCPRCGRNTVHAAVVKLQGELEAARPLAPRRRLGLLCRGDKAETSVVDVAGVPITRLCTSRSARRLGGWVSWTATGAVIRKMW